MTKSTFERAVEPRADEPEPHTPGPWTVGADDPKSVWASGHYIAETFTDGEANARLIAAGPEMLAALRDLYELCTFGASADAFRNGVTDSTGMIDEGDVRASDRLCAARAAIAKAEGRA